MRSVLMSVLRFVVICVQMAGLLAFFHEYSGWGSLSSLLAALAVSLFLPFAGAILGCIAAIKVWGWSWLMSLLVFLPGLILPLLAVFGVAGAGAWSLMRWRRPGRVPDSWATGRQQSGRGDIIEGEVIHSRTDDPR